MEQGHPDVVLMDLNYARDTTSGEEGLELLEEIARLDGHLPVVVMTAWASIDLAVEAMRRGARDFIEKPWDNSRLLQVLRTQVELSSRMKPAARPAAAGSFLGRFPSTASPADSDIAEARRRLWGRLSPEA